MKTKIRKSEIRNVLENCESSELLEKFCTLFDAEDDEKIKPIWEPEYGERYYYILIRDGGMYKYQYGPANKGDPHINNFNYYRTTEIAESEAEYLKVYRKLRHLARELNGDWSPNWDDPEQFKFSLIHSSYSQTWEICGYFTIGEPGIVWFKSEESAQIALDNLTEDEQKILMNGGNTK